MCDSNLHVFVFQRFIFQGVMNPFSSETHEISLTPFANKLFIVDPKAPWNKSGRSEKAVFFFQGGLTFLVKFAFFLLTPWKTNMSPENQWLENVFPTDIVPF